jgi:hypothetical protein
MGQNFLISARRCRLSRWDEKAGPFFFGRGKLPIETRSKRKKETGHEAE